MRHYVGVHQQIQTYGALDTDTGLFVSNLSAASQTTAVDPRALQINNVTIIKPRAHANLTAMTFTPTTGQAVAEVNIWKNSRLTPASRRQGSVEVICFAETWFWADFAQDVFFIGNNYVWEIWEQIRVGDRRLLPSFEVLASPHLYNYPFDPYHIPPDVSWTYQIQKLALYKATSLLGGPKCLTKCDEEALVHLEALRVLYLVPASNPDCKHGRPYTWDGGIGKDAIANDGFMAVETFQKRHPEKKNGDCTCAISAADLEKYKGYKTEVEKYFQGLKVPRKVEVKLVVDPYGG